ncbi:MAG: 2-dehydropantoate 2-reductase [Anaerolineales bacterium]|jgi:2-dehydropantoate 2-reductase
MHYLVLGTGAVGGMIGAQLSQAGFEVTFIDRSEVADQIRNDGLHVLGGSKPIHLTNPKVITNLAQIPDDHKPNAVVLAVKTYDAVAAAKMIRQRWPKPPLVISIINGIGVEEGLEEILGSNRVLAATLTSAIQKINVGVLRIEKSRGTGLAASHPLAGEIAAEWKQADLNPHLYPHAPQMKWSKLLTNLISNATSAITGLPAGQVYRHRGLYRLEIESLREAVRVMNALGFKPHNLPGVPVRLLSEAIFFPVRLIQPFLRRLVASGRGDKWPSFYYDVGRGRSEVEWLNGAVVDHGHRLGVPTPANTVLTEVLSRLIAGDNELETYRRSPMALIEAARQHQVPGF